MPSDLTDRDAPPLRYAIVGIGAQVMKAHRAGIERADVELVGGTDVSVAAGKAGAEAFGCPFFEDAATMQEAVAPDVIVVATPHPSHAAIAMAALDGGAHVLVEKPIAMHVGDADAMIDAAGKADRLLGVCYQNRFRPVVEAATQLIFDGAIGRIQHVTLRAVYPRTASYFRSADWRGTWAGEGGGVIMNQAPHSLDLLVAFLGPAQTVTAWTRTQLEPIQTEDTVDAMIGWEDGAVASVHMSVAEAGQPERLELTGTKGQLTLTPDGLSQTAFDDVEQVVAHDPTPMPVIASTPVPLEIDPAKGTHEHVYGDMNAAIRTGGAPAVDGRTGLGSLELANAVILSGHRREEVRLPLDRDAYRTTLDELIGRATERSRT